MPSISSEATEPLLAGDDDDVLLVAEESGKVANESRKKVTFQQSSLRLSSTTRHATSSNRRHLSSVNSAGLVGGGSTSAANEVIRFINRSGDGRNEGMEKKRVGLFAMFRYSSTTERWMMALGIIMAAIAGLSMPIWLLLLAESLETFNNIGKLLSQGASITILLDEMYKLIYSFAIVGAVSLVSGFAYVSIWTYVGEQQTLRIRKMFVASALKQDMTWFDATVGDPQELPVMAANSLGRVQICLGRTIADTFSNILSAAGCLAVALGLDAPLALFMLCVVPVIGVLVGIISCFMRKNSYRALGEFQSAGAFASEVLNGIPTIASLRAEQWAVRRYTNHVTGAQMYSVKTQFYSKLAAGIMGLLFYLTECFAFIYGTTQAAARTDTENSYRLPFACSFREDCGIHGSAVMVSIYGIILTAQFVALCNPGLNAINLGRIAAVDIYGAIERSPEIDGTDEVKGAKLGDEYDGSIDLQHVVFSYPSRRSDVVFRNLDLNIRAGSAVALVGPSGSGKSSLSKLLLRLYDPIGGRIVVGGTALKELNVKSWREKVGYVSQTPSLFPGTIRDNIAVGKINGSATDEEVIAAARAASAHEFICGLPHGYSTFFAGSSVQLSGGQLQRISIARALIRNPKVLILDEATSALDTASEKQVQDALERVRGERQLTTITIAHRLTTILNSDQIVVIADGEIQEKGTHRELVEMGGIYANLCEGQNLTANAAEVHRGSLPLENSPSEKGQDEEESLHFSKDGDGESEIAGDGEEKIDRAEVSRRIKQLSRKDFWYSVVGYAGSLIAGALPAGEAVLFGLITGNFFLLDNGDEMKATNTSLSLWFILLALLSFLGNVMSGIGFGVTGSRLTCRLRVLVFEKLMRYTISFFDFPENSTGELTTRLEEDSELVSNVTGQQLGQRVQVFATLATGLCTALAFSWEVGLTAMGCVPLIIGSSLIQSRYASSEPKTTRAISPATLLERAFGDLAVLHAYGLQTSVSDKYSSCLEPDVQYKKRQSCYTGMAYGLSQFAVFGTFALVFWAGIKLMLKGRLGFTDFFVALLAIMFSSFGVGQSGADFSSHKIGLDAAWRLFEVSDGIVDDEDDPLCQEGSRPQIEGNVKFDQVEFAYPTRKNAPVYYTHGHRQGLQLDIDSKMSVAFTGMSGCGKSTALQLLLRFYRVDSGAITVDGVNIQDINIGHLRDQIGYVGQTPVLFKGTIRDNILLGKPDATEEEVHSAAKSANAYEFTMELHDKFDTDIGVGGSLLSGGQRQRVAIARAIIKNPKILVLDEATAALDNESEKIVQAALDRMQETNPRTTLTVAHRLETVKSCSKIVVLDKGGVQEEGTHRDLLARRGLYFLLWTKQSGA